MTFRRGKGRHRPTAPVVPTGTPRELTVEAGRLLRELDGKPGVLGSGGLRASYKEDGTLSLKFILCESWSTINDDDPGHL